MSQKVMKTDPRAIDQENSQHAALLQDEIPNTIPGTENINTCAAAWAGSYTRGNEEDEVFDSGRMTQVPDTPIIGGSTRYIHFVTN